MKYRDLASGIATGAHSQTGRPLPAQQPVGDTEPRRNTPQEQAYFSGIACSAPDLEKPTVSRTEKEIKSTGLPVLF